MVGTDPGSRRSRSGRWRPGLLAAPYLVGTGLLVAVPLVAALGLALTDYSGLVSPEFTGLDNLRRALSDPALGRALTATLLLVLLVVPLRLGLSLAAALLLYAPRRGVARAAVFLPSVLPDTAWALLWLWLLNPLYGPLAALIGPGSGFLTDPWPTRVGLAVMLALQIGEGFVVCLAARSMVAPSVYEAARAEGASRWYTTRRVTLPLMRPALIFLAARDVVLISTAVFVPILVLTGGGPRESTTTLPVYLYSQGFRYGDLGYATAVAVLVTVVSLSAALLVAAGSFTAVGRGRRRRSAGPASATPR